MEDQNDFYDQFNSTMKIKDQNSFGNQANESFSYRKHQYAEGGENDSSFDNKILAGQLDAAEISMIQIGNQNGSFSKNPSPDRLDRSEFSSITKASYHSRKGEYFEIPIDFLADRYGNLLNQIKFSTLTETKKGLEIVLNKWKGFANEVDELIQKFLIIRVVNPGAEKKKVIKLALEKELLAKCIAGLELVIKKLDECSDIKSKDTINQIYYEFFCGKICEFEKDSPVYEISSLVFKRECLKEKIKSYDDAEKAREFILKKVRNLYSSLYKEVRSFRYVDIDPIKKSIQFNAERHQLPTLNEEINKFDPLRSIR